MQPNNDLVDLGRQMLDRAKAFYLKNPTGQYPWTVLGKDGQGQIHVFRMDWDSKFRNVLYEEAEQILRNASILRYVLGAEAWLRHPEGDREALVLGGADSNGERWAQHHMISRGATGVDLQPEKQMINQECKGDIYTLLNMRADIALVFAK